MERPDDAAPVVDAAPPHPRAVPPYPGAATVTADPYDAADPHDPPDPTDRSNHADQPGRVDATLPPGPPPYWSPATPHLPPRPLAPPATPRPRWRRTRRACVVLAVVGVLVAASAAVVAVRTYQQAGTPAAAVSAYFAALARGDAATALASGDLPTGGRDLVGDDVLRAVLALAPLDDVRTGEVSRAGDTASVAVRYRIGGASPSEVDDRVDLVRVGDRWRLRRSAVAVDLSVTSAASWAAVPATTPFALPTGTQLVFPGAVPVLFRSPRLQVAPATGVVRFAETGDSLRVAAAVSERGRADVVDALRTALAACAAGGSDVDPFCPQPPAGRDAGVVLRSVPQSFAGTLTGLDRLAPDVAVAPDDTGIVTVSGSVEADGSWQVLDYDNVPLDRSGATTITFGATLPVGADTLAWERT